MISDARRRKLLKILAERQAATVAELEGPLNASAATVRREIAVLAMAKQLTKVHGGVLHLAADKPTSLAGQTFQHNMTLHRNSKQANARCAAAM